MLKRLILALALLQSTSAATNSNDRWLTMVVGVVCKSEAALRKHFALLPDQANKEAHQKILTPDCKWLDVGIIYAVGEVSIINHGNRSLLFGALSWPGEDSEVGYGIVRRPQMGSMTDI